MDGIIYINLDHRKDRLKEIRAELDKHSLTADRIEGVFDELNGARGCALSHIKALDYALERAWEHVLILEDDCMFARDPSPSIHAFLDHFEDRWDVFFLGGLIFASDATSHPGVQRVIFSVRAHAYAVRRSYIKTLRENYQSSADSMKDDLFFISSFEKAIDRRWSELQKCDRWFAIDPQVAEQRESYSDIEKEFKSRR